MHGFRVIASTGGALVFYIFCSLVGIGSEVLIFSYIVVIMVFVENSSAS